MRVSIIIIGLCTMAASLYPTTGHTQNPEDVRISLQLDHASLTETLHRIEELTPFKFLAKAEDVENEKDITLAVTNQSVASILQLVFRGRDI